MFGVGSNFLANCPWAPPTKPTLLFILQMSVPLGNKKAFQQYTIYHQEAL